MASDLEAKAKEAFVEDHFELAVDLLSQAIHLEPNKAEFYADRAQANIKLNNFTGTPSRPPLKSFCFSNTLLAVLYESLGFCLRRNLCSIGSSWSKLVHLTKMKLFLLSNNVFGFLVFSEKIKIYMVFILYSWRPADMWL